MNTSKLYEWLLDNDCPWDFDHELVDEDSVYLMFTEKNKEET